MCFYYAIIKKRTNSLVKAKIIRNNQLDFLEEKQIVNGFSHPIMPVITDDNPDTISMIKWGFLPNNIESKEKADEFLTNYSTLNAKYEDIGKSKLYADSFKNSRCLVLCSGFFEWRKVNNEKIPYYITLKNEEMFVFAGIQNETTYYNGQKIKTFSILTIKANELMAKIHNTKLRMPLIISSEIAKQWINKELTTNQLKKLLIPIPSNNLKAHTIKKFLPKDISSLNALDLITYYNYPEIFGLLSEQETKL